MKLLQLLHIHLRRSLHHQTGGILYLRESDHVADAVGSHHQHDHTVQAVGQAGMGRNAIFKGIQKEAELLVGPLRRKAQDLKHLLLDISLMDTHRTAAQLCSV